MLRVYTAWLTYPVFYRWARLEPRWLSPVPVCKRFSSVRQNEWHALHVFLIGSLVSRHPSRLDAFSVYDLPRSCGACSVEQPLTRGDRALFLSYWTHAALKLPTAPLDRIRPVSRRSKPSSRSLLMGVQPHPWPLLHGQDRKSRHRGSKPQGRYELLPATTLLPPG